RERVLEQRDLRLERYALEHRDLLLDPLEAQHARAVRARDRDDLLVHGGAGVVVGLHREIDQSGPRLDARDDVVGDVASAQLGGHARVRLGADQRLEPPAVVELLGLEEPRLLARAEPGLDVQPPRAPERAPDRLRPVKDARSGDVDRAEDVPRRHAVARHAPQDAVGEALRRDRLDREQQREQQRGPCPRRHAARSFDARRPNPASGPMSVSNTSRSWSAASRVLSMRRASSWRTAYCASRRSSSWLRNSAMVRSVAAGAMPSMSSASRAMSTLAGKVS